MNIRTAIFASVASAGVVASGWFGVATPPGTTATAVRPATVALPSPGSVATGGRSVAAGGGSVATGGAARMTGGTAVATRGGALATGTGGPRAVGIDRDRLVTGASVQVVGGALYTPKEYAASLQAAVDRKLAAS